MFYREGDVVIATATLWPLWKPQYWWRHHPVLDLFWIQIITLETLDYTSHFLTINVFKVYLYTVVCSIIKSLQADSAHAKQASSLVILTLPYRQPHNVLSDDDLQRAQSLREQTMKLMRVPGSKIGETFYSEQMGKDFSAKNPMRMMYKTVCTFGSPASFEKWESKCLLCLASVTVISKTYHVLITLVGI